MLQGVWTHTGKGEATIYAVMAGLVWLQLCRGKYTGGCFDHCKHKQGSMKETLCHTQQHNSPVFTDDAVPLIIQD